jgi:hypothetical protein
VLHHLLKHIMKRYYFAIVLVVLLISCKQSDTQADSSNGGPYPAVVVSTLHKGIYEAVPHADIIKQEWAKKLEPGNTITDLKIVKSKITGNKQLDFYMLVATAGPDKTTMATLLTEKNGALYFEQESGIITLCSSKCPDGCQPYGIWQNGKIRIVCSPCPECLKTEEFL